MMTRGGKKIMLSLIASPIFDDEGKVSGGIGVFRDISRDVQEAFR